MFWTYVVTLGVFPVLCFITGTGVATVHNYSLVTLLYNIGDFSGKAGAGLFGPRKTGGMFYAYGFFRGLVLAVLFGFCVLFKDNLFWGSPALSIVLILVLGFTNGHFTTLNFQVTPGLLGDKARFGASLLVINLLLLIFMYI